MRKISIALLCAALSACAMQHTEVASCPACDAARKLQQAAMRDPGDDKALDAYLATLAETPKGSGFYAVEGDLRLSREQIRVQLAQVQQEAAPKMPGELIVNVVGGQYDYWRKPEDRHLTYAFDTASFPSSKELDATRMHLAAAAKDWMDACPKCGITFTDVSNANGPNQPAPTFRVVYAPPAGSVIAQSFFPSDAPADRILYVFPIYFTNTGFDATGVLRHELGHVIGYRHEHIIGIAGCATEGGSWKMLTPYTPNSVMHYFCGGAGSLDLALRDQDKRGHRCLYLTGKPCPA